MIKDEIPDGYGCARRFASRMAARAVLTGLALLLCAVPAMTTPLTVKERWPNRDRITEKIADLQKISTPEGIDVLEQVDIGGAKQWISMRGQNRANPILLVIHGGPGTPMMPMSWAYQKPWEDYFTVVNWDQRGVGKNAATADHEALQKTLTMDQMVSDAEQVVAFLRTRLHKAKVVVLGYSWGSILGAELAKQRPDWVSAYVGVGQSVNADDEKYIYDRTLALAHAHRDVAAQAALKALAPYPRADGNTPFMAMIEVRRWAMKYNGGFYGHDSFMPLYTLPEWSPLYTDAEADAWGPANGWAGDVLSKAMNAHSLGEESAEYKVPFFLFQGRYDLHTPYVSAAAYFETVKAPYKKMETFERSSHLVMMEEPGRFLVKLVEDVLPVTGEATYFQKAPDAP